MRLEYWLYTVPLRLRSVFRRRRVEEELDEELRYHLEETMRERTGAGISDAQARRDALREIGGLEQAKERCRDARGLGLLETTIQDVRYGLRGLRKHPGFSSVVVLTLALGLGANTAIFSLVNGILLVPLPYRSPDRLVSITGTYPKGALVAMREQIRTMDIAGYSDGHEVNLTGRGEAVRLTAAFVSAELFSVLGAAAQVGRTYATGEDSIGRDGYVVLSDSVWQRTFGRDPGIVGRIIDLDGMPREVVGIMPAAFRFPSPATDLWVPLRNDPRALVGYWAGDFMPVVGRLTPGATIATARADLQLFQPQVLKKFPWPMPASWNEKVSVEPLQTDLVAGARVRLLMLLGAVGLVLLIACANVANLTLARSAGRFREIAVRSALGAGRRRIVRQLLTESILLSSFGGGLGILLATQGLRLLQATLPADTPRLFEVQIDWRVLTFTGALAILTGIAFGIMPALQGSRAALGETLRTGRGSAVPVSNRLRGALVVAEVAMAVWLVIGATLLIRSVWALAHVSPGFHSDRVVTTRLTPNPSFCAEAERCVAFYRDVLSEVQKTPGVQAAGLVNTLPLGGRVTKRSVNIEGLTGPSTQTSPLLWLNTVTPDYFRAMGITLLAGRPFTDADASGSSLVAMVDESTARRFWEGESPIGRRVRFVGSSDWHVIVGVVPDLKAYSLQQRVPSWIAGTLYVPYNTTATTEDGRIPAALTLAVRTSMDEGRTLASLSQIVANVKRDVPISDAKTMNAVMSEAVSTPASTATLFSTFAGLALLLGMIGIYGVLSFLVSRRTQEIGLRIALGAQRSDVLWLIARDAARLTGTGILLGLAGAVGLARLLSRELYGISPLDPATYVGVTFAVGLVTTLACGIPTLRGLRVDPVVALRNE
jgi:putative ABC transport system permease protein